MPYAPNVLMREEEKTKRKLKERTVKDIDYRGNSS